MLPDHGGDCVSSLVPAVLSGRATDLVPAEVVDAPSVVLLVIDGLGWHQLRRHSRHAPILAAASGDPITTVAPSTTAAALTSIATGVAPGEHGVVGYRVRTGHGVLNCLRWTVGGRDATESVPPAELQPLDPFLGTRPPVVTRAEFRQSGFTEAHLRDGGWFGWHTPFSMVGEIVGRVRAGARFVYAYYDGLDKVGHVYGLEGSYLDELEFVDLLVARLVDSLPSGTEVLVTADHGLVHVGDRLVDVDPDVLQLTAFTSGEARFMWLHARSGATADLLTAAAVHHDVGWVVGIEQVLDERWFGHAVTHDARLRLGDVALVARDPVAFVEPRSPDGAWLVGRHGGLTAEEMHVPCVRFSCP